MKKIKVLVTGGVGFVGSHLVQYLQEKGNYDITVFDKLESPNKGKENKYLHYVKGDLLNKKDVTNVFKQFGPFTSIFHLASAMPNKEVTDEMIWKINVEGIKNLIEEAIKNKTTSFVFTSSNVTYGIPKELPTTEQTPLLPLEMYGRSKAQAEKELGKYKDKMNIQIIRLPVTTGTGRLGLQAILFEFISENKNVYVLGNGQNLYQFVDVDDACQALEKANHIKGFDIYNIGADKTMTLRELYKGVISHAKSTASIISIPKAPALFTLSILDRLNISPLGVYQYTMMGQSLYTDTTKIKKRLLWKPTKTNLDTFLDNYNWYMKNKGKFAQIGSSEFSSNRSLPKMGVLNLLKRFS